MGGFVRGVEEKIPNFGDIASPTVEHTHPSLARRTTLSRLGQVVFEGWGGAQPSAWLSSSPSIHLVAVALAPQGHLAMSQDI